MAAHERKPRADAALKARDLPAPARRQLKGDRKAPVFASPSAKPPVLRQ